MIMPDMINIDLWAKKGITANFIFNSLDVGIHPINWVREDVLKEMYDNYMIRACYSKCGNYYKVNYGNIMFRDFQNYQFLFLCRGDVLRTDSNVIVAKAPNKFWNIDENIYTKSDSLCWSSSQNKVVEKMDGMMILPYKNDDGEWKLTSRGSFEYDVIPIAEKYFTQNYIDFCEECLGFKTYPIFEIISKESFIKVEYPEDKYGLYFLGCSRIDGEISRPESDFETAKKYGIKTPEIYDLTTKEQIYNFVNSHEHYYDFEGVVFHTFRGTVKIKSTKYCEMNIQKLDNIESLYEMWNENEIDDVLSHLPPIQVENIIQNIQKFKAYKNYLNEEYLKISPDLEKLKDIKEVVEYLQNNCDSKYFHFFLNKHKNNPIIVEKSRKHLTLAHIKELEKVK
jgi:hypothetical protein